MKTLPIYSVKERRPANGEEIILFHDVYSFGLDMLEVKIVTVEYSWFELDEVDGSKTGNQVYYEDNHTPDSPPEGCVLELLIDSGYILDPATLYATAKDVLELVEEPK